LVRRPYLQLFCTGQLEKAAAATGLRTNVIRGYPLTSQIRDLEARVEILSGDKEERVELMLLLVRNLLKENKDLRSMVKSMATFIGEGE